MQGRGGSRHVCRRNDVAGNDIRSGPRAGVPVDGRGRDVSEVDANGEIGQRREIVIKGVGKHHFSGGNVHCRRAVKRQRLVAGGVDGASEIGEGARGQGHVGRIDGHGIGSVGIGKPNAQMISANGSVNKLPKRAVGQRCGGQISRLRQLRAAAPGAHPMTVCDRGRLGRAEKTCGQ